MDEVSFGDWLKRRRKAAGLTQEQLAQEISCSTSALKKIEAEDRRPSAQIVQRLAEIFNIPSSEQLRFLRFARGDWNAVPVENIEDAPWRTSAKILRSNLPAPTSSLVGREKAMADVRGYLLNKDIRLVTLLGPPGIGKTRLSIELARALLNDFPEGMFFVALAPLEHPSLIASTIVQTLAYTEEKNRSARKQLVDGIGEKQMLIVLDNCEHLIQEVAELVSELLSACSHLKILTTSRESLRISGEWLYSVPTLEVLRESAAIDIETAAKVPALTLFAERARAVRSDFVLDADNIQAVGSICVQLDGLPLAIELIAARIRLMSSQTLLAKLNDQFVLYADGMRALPVRQKSLHNAIHWSYNLLSAEEQGLFVRLSVFSGGFTIEAAESIFARTVSDTPVTDLIASLLDKSLLQRTLNERGEPRFSMLATIQIFAANHLREKDEDTEVRNWHRAYFLELAEQADKEIHGPAQVEWMNRLELEHDNFRAALDWGVSSHQTRLSLRMLNALSWIWLVRNHFSEAESWFDKISSLSEIRSHPELHARLLNFMGRLRWFQGDLPRAREILKKGQKIWLELGVKGAKGLAECLDFLGLVTRSLEGEGPEIARSLLEESLNLYEIHGDLWGKAFTHFLLGVVALQQNKITKALSELEKSIDLFRQLGDVWGISRVSEHLGECFFELGNYEKARLYFEQHLRLDEELSFKPGIVLALNHLGDLYRYQGVYDQAYRFYERSLWMCREYDVKSDRGYHLYALGMVALHREDYLLAKKLFHDYFISRREFAEKTVAYEFLTGWAAIAATTNEPERAARLIGAAKAISYTIDQRIPPFDQAEFDRHIQIARQQLGEITFQALQAEGQAMAQMQAIDYALELSTN